MPNIFRTRRPTNFKFGSQTEYEDPHHRQAPWLPRSKVKVARSRDASDRWWPISREWNVLETPKLVQRLSIPRAIMRTSFNVKGQRSRSQDRLMLRPEVRHFFPSGKAYGDELHTWYTDGARSPASPTSAMTSKVKGQGGKVTWSVWELLDHYRRTKSHRNTKIGRKIAHATDNNAIRQFYLGLYLN